MSFPSSKTGLGLLVLAGILLVASPKPREGNAAFERGTGSAAGSRSAKASDRSGGNLAVFKLSPEAAAGEIRRLCHDSAGKPSLGTLESFYDFKRLDQLIRRLDLQQVRLLRDDPDLLRLRQAEEDLAMAALCSLRERFGELAPQEVLTLGTYHSGVSLDFKVFEFVDLLRGAGKGDPDAAFAFWKDHLQDFGKDTEPVFGQALNDPLFHIIEGATKNDPGKAWEIIGRLDSARRPDQVLGSYFRSLPPGSDWEKAVGQLESCHLDAKSGSISAPALALAQAWMKDDPAAAMQWLDRINDSLPQARAGSLAASREDGEELAVRAAVYSEALQSWLYTDPIEALHWLRGWQPADASKLEVIREAMNGAAPAIERELLALVESPEERSQLVLALARDARGMEDFDMLLAAGGLPESTVKQLQTIKDRFRSGEGLDWSMVPAAD